MTKRLDFPFFGGCWIERPSDEEREKVAVYLPLLKDLDESIMSLEYYRMYFSLIPRTRRR
jgi:hypothetical protein